MYNYMENLISNEKKKRLSFSQSLKTLKGTKRYVRNKASPVIQFCRRNKLSQISPKTKCSTRVKDYIAGFPHVIMTTDGGPVRIFNSPRKKETTNCYPIAMDTAQTSGRENYLENTMLVTGTSG